MSEIVERNSNALWKKQNTDRGYRWLWQFLHFVFLRKSTCAYAYRGLPMKLTWPARLEHSSRLPQTLDPLHCRADLLCEFQLLKAYFYSHLVGRHLN